MQKIQNFRKFHFKKFTVLYHVKFFQSADACRQLILRHMINNDHIKLCQKYWPSGCVFSAIFPLRGHPNAATQSKFWSLLVLAELILMRSCYWFVLNRRLMFTAGVTSEKLQSRPIMTKLDPTQPSHMQSAIKYEKKKSKSKKIENYQR